jgi:hypothetical protein
VSERPWWTSADSAEASALIYELVTALRAHGEGCQICTASCDLPRAIATEWEPYDLAPLDGPAGLYADVRRRRAEHYATCEDCALVARRPCPSVGAAIDELLDWRRRRALLSRAEYLRRLQDRVGPEAVAEWELAA